MLEPEVERGGRHRILVGDGAGYRLETEPGELDIDRFERLTEEARDSSRHEPGCGSGPARRGARAVARTPLADLAFEPFAQPEIHRLDELRLAALEDRLEALLARAATRSSSASSRRSSRASRCASVCGASCCSRSTARGGKPTRSMPTRAPATCWSSSSASSREPTCGGSSVEFSSRIPTSTRRFPGLGPVYGTPPRPAGRLLGRAADVERVAALLREHRLVTLLGPGGVGKTRLALAVAARVAGDFPDGVAWAPLEAIREPPLVTSEIAVALGNADDVAAELEGRRVLLVLDNLEQVLGCAVSLAELIAATSDVRMLVTSREPLDIAAERRYQVPLLERSAAIELFNDRADAVGAIVDEDAAAVAAICDRLEGLPLAVELAAARTTVFSPEELLRRLDSASDLLDGARRDAPDRHHTLRATISWSHDLLDDAERALFQQLSVFAGGCTLDSAAVVTQAGLDAVSSLVGKSLLRAGDGRIRMLATIREFAQERLEESGDASEVGARHARHYLDLARVADEELTGPDHAAAFTRLAQEQDNIRAALTWAVASDRELALELAAAVGWFWFVRGQLDEGTLWLEAALAADGGAAATRATVSMRAGAIADARGDYGRAEAHYRVALQLRRDGGDLAGAVGALNNLGALAHSQADHDAALSWYEQGLALAREIGDDLGTATALGNMGIVAVANDDPARAVELLEESIALSEPAGQHYALAISRQALGSALLELGDTSLAATQLLTL